MNLGIDELLLKIETTLFCLQKNNFSGIFIPLLDYIWFFFSCATEF